MYRYNSTLKIKVDNCVYCGLSKPVFRRDNREPVCKECATIRDVQQATEEENARIVQTAGLTDLVDRLDDIYSKWLRLSQANEYGRVNCYTCNNYIFWTAAQTGHYISRGIYRLRWDIRNTYIQDYECNVQKGGNMKAFTERMERDYPGRLEFLNEEKNLPYKLDRHELNAMILEYTQKFKALKK